MRIIKKLYFTKSEHPDTDWLRLFVVFEEDSKFEGIYYYSNILKEDSDIENILWSILSEDTFHERILRKTGIYEMPIIEMKGTYADLKNVLLNERPELFI